MRRVYLNRIEITGNLVADPEIRKTKTHGDSVVNFRLANNRKYRDSTGQPKEDVCFISVTAWHKLAEAIYDNLIKGSFVLVEGELQGRFWETPEGEKHNVPEIRASKVTFLDNLRNEREKTEDETLAVEEDYNG